MAKRGAATGGDVSRGVWSGWPASLAQRLLQNREAVGIEALRRLQHRRFHGKRSCRRPLIETTLVARNVALRGGAAPALENRADEMRVVARGDRGHGGGGCLAARPLMRRHFLEAQPRRQRDAFAERQHLAGA